jgi:hypothetical protein
LVSEFSSYFVFCAIVVQSIGKSNENLFDICMMFAIMQTRGVVQAFYLKFSITCEKSACNLTPPNTDSFLEVACQPALSDFWGG